MMLIPIECADQTAGVEYVSCYSHDYYKQTFQSNAKCPLSDCPSFIVNKLELVGGGACTVILTSLDMLGGHDPVQTAHGDPWNRQADRQTDTIENGYLPITSLAGSDKQFPKVCG